MRPSAVRNSHSGYGVKSHQQTPDERRHNSMIPPALPGRRSTMNTSAIGMTPRQSSIPLRNSTAFNGNQQQSRSIHKDPRQLTDRSVLQQSIRTIITFLMDRGYGDMGLSPKVLTSPSSKEFISIFTFILQKFDPHFTFLPSRKFEDEMPILLKCFGYPYNISKSSLSAIGSPHTWPNLVGVLLWFIGLVQFDELSHTKENEQMNILENEDYNVKRINFFLKNTLFAYKGWLNGEETFNEADEQHEAFFKNESEGRNDDIKSLEDAVSQLTITDNTYKKNPSPIIIAQEQLKSIESNIVKMNCLLKALLNHLDGVEKLVNEKKLSNEKDKEELIDLNKRKEELVPVLARQDEEAIDAEQIVRDGEKFKNGLLKVQNERERVEKRQKQLETRCSNNMEKLHNIACEHNRKLDSFDNEHPHLQHDNYRQIINKKTLSIVVNRDGCETDERKIINRDLESEVIKVIEDVKKKINEGASELNNEILKVHEELDEEEEKSMVLKHEVGILKGQKERKEQEYERKKLEMQLFLEQRSKDILEEEEKCNNILKVEDEAIKEKDVRLKELDNTLIQLKERRERTRIHIAHILKRQVTALKEEKQTVKDTVTEISEHVKEQVKAFNVVLSSSRYS